MAQQLAALGDAALLLIDDFRGREAAQHSGVAAMGTAGVLLLAKQTGAITTVKPLLIALRKEGYFLSDRLMVAVCQQAGE